MTAWTYILILIGSTMTALGGVFLKKGSLKLVLDQGPLSLASSIVLNLQLSVGLFLYVIPISLWIYLLRSHELSKLQPLLAMVYAITPIVAIVFLHESVGLIRWLGIGFIILGVSLVAQS